MANHPVEILRGTPEQFRSEAAELYESAFGPKFSVAVPNQKRRVQLITRAMLLPYSIAAVANGKLLGIAGYRSSQGSLTGGITYEELIDQLGFWRGNRAALIFSLYERKKCPDQLLMDGIAVAPESRGQGIGTRLLDEMILLATEQGYKDVRLDVIDTNPGARKLYERNQFVATKTEHFGYLRWLLGFGASTTMARQLGSE